MTPMREKFYQRRREEMGTTFSWNPAHEKVQKEHGGLRTFVHSPFFWCPICDVTEIPCDCTFPGEKL